jgi:hypothetical protein
MQLFVISLLKLMQLFVISLLKSAIKNVKNKIIPHFWAGISVGHVSQPPWARTKQNSTSLTSQGWYKSTIGGMDEGKNEGARSC